MVDNWHLVNETVKGHIIYAHMERVLRFNLENNNVSLLGPDNLDPEHVKLCLNLRIIIFTNAPERKFTVRMFVILLLGY